MFLKFDALIYVYIYIYHDVYIYYIQNIIIVGLRCLSYLEKRAGFNNNLIIDVSNYSQKVKLPIKKKYIYIYIYIYFMK